MSEAQDQKPITFSKALFWMELAGYKLAPSWNNDGMFKGTDPRGQPIGIVNKIWIQDTAFYIWAEYYKEQ